MLWLWHAVQEISEGYHLTWYIQRSIKYMSSFIQYIQDFIQYIQILIS